MKSRILLSIVLLLAAFSSRAVVLLDSGESYRTSFSLESDGGVFKETDNFWEMFVKVVDSENPPFNFGGTGFITVSLFENIDFTGLAYTDTRDSSNWASPSSGMGFWGSAGLFTDFNGSLTLTYNGTGVASLQAITISNFAGTQGDSFVATTSFEPVASPVPWPPAAMLFLPGLLVTAFVASRRMPRLSHGSGLLVAR